MKPHGLFLMYEKEVAEFKLELIRKISVEEPTYEINRKKRTTQLSMAENVLKTARKPLHVNEIIALVKQEFGVTLDRDSMSSSLLKQVSKGIRFVRVAPNTFTCAQSS